MHQKFLRALLLPLLILLLMSAVLPLYAQADVDIAASEKLGIIDALNALRKQYGVGALTSDPHLETAAQRQAEYLAEIGGLETNGPSGETVHEQAADAGYGGDKAFTADATNAMVWVDTDIAYLVENVWRKSQQSVRVIFNQAVRQAGVGIAEAPDKHRYIVLITAGLNDGTNDYSLTKPTYDVRTPKPTISATPTPQPLVTSTANPDGGVYHIVQEGETFSEIALAYGLDWFTLSSRNNIKLSDTTPVVIMEGQMLVIQPTYTLTPTPTPTKTPVPPTNTPRPTYTPGAEKSNETVQPPVVRLSPDPVRFLDWLVSWQPAVGWILVGISIPGLWFSLRRRK